MRLMAAAIKNGGDLLPGERRHGPARHDHAPATGYHAPMRKLGFWNDEREQVLAINQAADELEAVQSGVNFTQDRKSVV